jgi:hypothetical protein
MEEQAKTTQPQVQPVDKPSVLKSFPKKAGSKSAILIILGSFLVVLVGVGSGWLLSGRALGISSSKTAPEGAAPGVEESVSEAGVSDLSGFPDEAEGMLVEGGIEGEGTHYLDRDLGPEKYVYMTSTVIDLQSFVGKKVKVWGQTISGKHAGWLMDVGKIKIIE